MTPSLSRRGPWLAVLVVVALVSAGCLSPDGGTVTRPLGADEAGDGAGGNNTTADGGGADGNVTGDGAAGDQGDTDDDNTAGNGTDDGAGGDNTTAGNDTDTGDGDNNTTYPPQDPIEWPALEDAVVRPGVQVYADGGQCTSNFLYRSPVNGTLYLGAAAHCFYDNNGVRLTEVAVYGTDFTKAFDATLAWDSWHAMGHPAVVKNPATGRNQDNVHPFDFAFIEIPAEHVDKVHPAVMHFGGPTRLGTPDDMGTLKKVISFGASSLRPVGGPGDWHEGYIVDKEPWTVTAYTVAPGIPGDSGSSLMTKDGAAIGALSVLQIYGFDLGSFDVTPPASNGYTDVPASLEWLEKNGWPLELQTWEIINGPLSPI